MECEPLPSIASAFADSVSMTCILGWKAYFGLTQTRGVLHKQDGWMRHRLASNPFEAMETRPDELPGIAETTGQALCCAIGCCKQPPPVTQQQARAEQRADDWLFRSSMLAWPHFTSTAYADS
ncbi:group II intron maturase-specific domain-containing protein [Massilia sp. S19_KUP03_FR1]|uniref:group II intron maturase-specific domain-containing protein n=1 Tax=Massilia sp. S19_KUP03_FR1 TaxID=3025503 RepID=UPI002FCDB2DE